MKCTAFFAAVLAFCAVSQAAQPGGVAFTQPVTSPTLKGNENFLVMWQVDASKLSNPNSVGTLQLAFSRDGSTNVEVVKTINDKIVLSSKSFSWAVPADVQSSKEYSLVMMAEGTPFYSPKFAIDNGGQAPADASKNPAQSPKSAATISVPAVSVMALATLVPVALGFVTLMA